MQNMKKAAIACLACLFMVGQQTSAYAYELLDIDGDGKTDKVRFCDGYVRSIDFYTWFSPQMLPVTGEIVESESELKLQFIEKDDEWCRKAPGELRWYDENLGTDGEIEDANRVLEEQMVQEALAASDSWEKRLEIFGSIIDAKCKNIDLNAPGFTHWSIFEDHEPRYAGLKSSLVSASERQAFLTGQFPLTEADYMRQAEGLLSGNAYKLLPAGKRTGEMYCVNDEWYEIKFSGSSANITKGISEETIQGILRIDPREYWRASDYERLNNYPEVIKQRMKEAGKWPYKY